MKRIISSLCMILLLVGLIPSTVCAKGDREMRAAWIATVSNIDFPSQKGDVGAQKEEFRRKLDSLQKMGINTVIVQVRPKADALYQSDINPWSDILTGVQGMYPGYDPLAFMINEAHKRGMELHAWLNPYRITTSGTDMTKLSANHPARLSPSWVMNYNNALYYNPEVEGVKQHIVDTVEEIIKNYNVDGIHFDDYFYPSNYPLPAGEGQDGVVANQRRAHVNEMVERVSKVVKQTDPNVVFGISPMGIWKNSKSDPTGSHTGGGESYYRVYADTRTWIQNEWIDYVVPQIYWEIGHSTADYETLVKWWSNEVKGTDVDLYIGQGVYKDIVAAQIKEQLNINKKYSEVKGSMYFSAKDLLSNRQGVADALTLYYGGGSTVPDIKPEEPEKPVEPEQPVVPEVPSEPIQKGIVKADRLNVRSGPGKNYSVLTQVNNGEKVDILKTSGAWYQVQLKDGQTGFVSQEFVQIEGLENPLPNGEIRLVIGAVEVKPTVAPVLQKGTTLVPLRVISEQLKAKVDWDGKQKLVTITKGDHILKLTIGNKNVTAGNQTVALEVAPQIIQETTMVPIRFISENLGAVVNWQPETKTIYISE